MRSHDASDDESGDDLSRRRFARITAAIAGALSLPGVVAAHHDSRSEEGERHGRDDGAHEHGRDHESDDSPENNDERRRDDDHRPDDSEDDAEDDRDNDDDDSDGEDGGDDDDNGTDNENDGTGGGDGNGSNDGDNSDGNGDTGGGDGGGSGDGGDGGSGGGSGNGGNSGDVQVMAMRMDDGSVFTGGQTNQVNIIVDASEPVFIRDQFPIEWVVVAGDPNTTYTQRDVRFVEFMEPVENGTRTYLAEAPTGLTKTGAYEFGPIEYSLDGETWTEVPGTTETNTVVGADTNV